MVLYTLIFIFLDSILWWSNRGRWDGWGMCEGEERSMQGFGCGIWAEEPKACMEIILKWILNTEDMWSWTGFIDLHTGASGGLLWMRSWTFGFG